jgi:hypothetical protein
MKTSTFFRSAMLVALAAAAAFAAPMTTGKADLKSAGPLAFGPDGILFVGDSMSAKIFAIDTEDRTANNSGASLDVKGIDAKIAAALGTMPDQISIKSVAVNPVSKRVYLSVARGKGADGIAVIVRLDASGKISELPLDNVKFSSTSLPNPAERANQRMDTITEVRYVTGKVLVAGLSNEEFQSNMRSIAYPFETVDKGASIEMYHGSHGRFETNSPVRTFVPYSINNQQYILAAYTCTPLVKIPVSSLKPGAQVKGVTIADLGSGNQPLDMVPYKKGGHDYILVANSTFGILKLKADSLESYAPIDSPTVTDVAGVPFDRLSELKNVQHLAQVDATRALILTGTPGEGPASAPGSARGRLNLQTIALP